MIKQIYLSLFFCILGYCATAQTTMLQNYAPVSPNATALGSYGNIPVTYYTGTPQVDVPVYTIKTNSISYPIGLDYHADGLKILGESTFVGLDWTLSSMGVITRSVNWLDDFSSNGYFRNAPSSRTPGSGIDPAPDVFYYNFAGKVGKFVIDYPGTIRLLNRQDDISITFDASNNFTITAENGNAYYFSKHENQTNTITITGGQNLTQTVNYVTAWYLTSITAPNGETVTFNYLPTTCRTIENRTSSVTSQFNSLSMTNETACAQQAYGNLVSQYRAAYNVVSTTATHSVTDEVLLDNIVFSGGKIQFYYSDSIDLQNDYSNGGTQSQKLDQIIVYDNNFNIVKNAHFAYGYFNSNTGQSTYTMMRMKLLNYQEVPVSGSGNYNYVFSYNESTSFPPKIDANFEPFGYYSTDPTIGMLTKITYPTGGATFFSFEPNDAGKYGARVKTIQNLDASGNILDDKVFQYTELDANNNTVTSGKPMDLTMRSVALTAPGSYTCTNTGNQSSTSILTIYYTLYNQYSFTPIGESVSGNPYGYDQVTVLEGKNGENGKTIYYYYNIPDVVTAIGTPSQHNQNDGNLLSEELYKNIGAGNFGLLKKTNYTIQARNQIGVTGSSLSLTTKNSFVNYTINTQNEVLATEEEKQYDGSMPSDQVTQYTYNPNYQQVATEQTTSSQGNTLTTINRYPYDMTALGQTVPYQNMVSENIISLPVQVEKQINGAKLIETINNYTQSWTVNPNLILVSNIQSQNNSNAVETRVTNNSYDNYGNPTSLSLTQGPKVSYQWGYNGIYVYAQCKNADINEFLFQGFEDNQTNVSGSLTIGSGHTGTHFISQPATVNWTAPNNRSYIITYWYRTSGVWTYSGEHAYSGTSYTLSGGDAYDDIRVYPADAQLNTYTYNPLIGLSSETDPKGKTTYYEYDGFNRLMNIKNQYGEIVKNFRYNYVTVTPSFPSAPAVCDEQVQGCKTINGTCQSGAKVCTASVMTGTNQYICTYHYLWSDGTVSQNYTQLSPYPCAISP